MAQSGVAVNQGSGLRLHGWRDGPVLATSVLVLAAGFGQFGAVAALGDVAREFGEVADGPTLAEQAGLSGTARDRPGRSSAWPPSAACRWQRSPTVWDAAAR